LDFEQIKPFLKKPYKIIPSKRPNEYYVCVPKFIDFQVGWLSPELSDDAWNVFVINKYLQWLEPLPKELREELKLPEPKGLFVENGELIFPEGMEDEIQKSFGEHLSSIEKGRARIKPASEFFLLAELIEKGELPFRYKPVSKEDLREPQVNFDFSGKWEFQKEAVEKFLQYGNIGIFWFTSAGKSFPAMYIMDMIKGKKALVVPNLTVKEQWVKYFKEYAPRLLKEVEIYTYLGGGSYGKMLGKEYNLICFDEVHMLPADTFSRLATIKTKYRIGLSATPMREDFRENYIIALTGVPLGQRWQDLIKQLGKEYHKINVYIVQNESAKIRKVKEIFDPNKKTIIYSFKLDLGEKISKMLGIPFIYGETKGKERLEAIKNYKSLVASSIVDLGVSVKDLEQIIEVSGLFGSRREEIQLTGRLFHSELRGKAHSVIMTIDEFYSYKKRFLGLIEKGFHINLIPCVKGFIFKEPEKEVKIKKKEEKKETRKFW
jgi:DNA excision repair protein ERCC-3